MNALVPKYFNPGFRNNQHETDLSELKISGHIPEWINGDLIRNGPGLVTVDKPMQHWFDGLAMLHRFRIHQGKVSYKSRFVDCSAYRAVKDSGKISYADFATDPCRSLFGKIQTIFNPDPKITDSAKVNVGKIGSDLYALGEPLMQIKIDPETLESLGVFHFEKNPGNRMTTAHPHTDKFDAYNLVVQYGPINYYKIYSLKNNVKELCSIPVKEPAYMHSFGMSENYFIISEFPLVVQSLKLALRLRPFIENFSWKPDHGTRFIIIDRRTGSVAMRVVTDAFFGFHHVNAFEKDDKLIVDMVNYKDASIIEHYYINRLEAAADDLPKGRLERFVFDLKNKSLERRDVLSETLLELPHIPYTVQHGNPDYNFVYGCGVHELTKNEFYNQLVKIDIGSGKTTSWYTAGCYPGEPVFVPNPEKKSEDDGVLLSVVLDADSGTSFLLVLHALDLKEIGRARLDSSILFGYHGIFESVNHP